MGDGEPWFTTGEFDAALRGIDKILGRPHAETTMESAAAVIVRGMIETFTGDYHQGRQDLRAGLEQARLLPPASYAILLAFWSVMSAFGLYPPDDLVDETRAALRHAEEFGDIAGIIAAQCAFGTVLLRAYSSPADEAIDVLRRAQANLHKHKMLTTYPMPGVSADLAIDAARNGRRDEAIDELRSLFSLHMARAIESWSAKLERP